MIERGSAEPRRLGSEQDVAFTADGTRLGVEIGVAFTADGGRLVTDAVHGELTTLHVWALPEGRLERTLTHPGGSNAFLVGDRLMTMTVGIEPDGSELLRRLPLDGGPGQVLGRWEPHRLEGYDVDPSGTWLYSIQGGRVLQQRLEDPQAPGRVVGVHEGGTSVCARSWRDRVVTSDSGGQLRVWDVPAARLERELASPADARIVALDPNGRFLAAGPFGDIGIATSRAFLFDLDAPRTAEPVQLALGEKVWTGGLSFSPDGSWLASAHSSRVALWNLTGARSAVLCRRQSAWRSVAFTPGGDLLATSSEGVLTRWALSPTAAEGVRDLWSGPPGLGSWFSGVEPGGRFAVVTDVGEGELHVVALDGSPVETRALKRAPGTRLNAWGTLSPDGRVVAASVNAPGSPAESRLRVVDLATGAERGLDTRPEGSKLCEEPGSASAGWAEPVWLPDGRLVSDGDAGVRLWDLTSGTSRLLRGCTKALYSVELHAGPDSRTILRHDRGREEGETSSLSTFNVESRERRAITSHGIRVVSAALAHHAAVLVTGSQDGVVRVGPLTGTEPHLLLGHSGPVQSVAVSPDGRWIASAGDDGTIRLWPMPDLSRPPLHTLPHAELLAKLESLTNLRAVRDPSSDTGWKVEIGPFPGWGAAPEWQP